MPGFVGAGGQSDGLLLGWAGLGGRSLLLDPVIVILGVYEPLPLFLEDGFLGVDWIPLLLNGLYVPTFAQDDGFLVMERCFFDRDNLILNRQNPVLPTLVFLGQGFPNSLFYSIESGIGCIDTASIFLFYFFVDGVSVIF